MRSTARVLACLFALVAAAARGPAQDDLRDLVRLKSGKELRGRIAEPFTTGDLLLLQGGRRVRVARADVLEIDSVADRIRAFLERRIRLADSARARWILVEWAESQGLHSLARLQALQVALEDDGEERAHAFLGHKQRGKQWLWEVDGRWVPREQLLAAIVKSPIELAGERYRVRTDGDLRMAVAALFDLERLGVWWFDTFGADLRLAEVLAPIEVFVHRDALSFPKWGFRPIPFYQPAPHGDLGHTFHFGPVPARPKLLFFVGSQGLLSRALIGPVSQHDDRDRACPWLEIGLPMLAEQTFAGDPGVAVPGAPRSQDLQALQALGRDYQLGHLLHLPMYGGFYLMDDTPTAVNWSACAMFVQFLLRPDNVPNTRSAFLSYVRAALGQGRGDSSSLFDSVMGRRVEDFDAPFRTWLEQRAGY